MHLIGDVPEHARCFLHPDGIRAYASWVDGEVLHRRMTEHNPPAQAFPNHSDAMAHQQQLIRDVIRNGFVEVDAIARNHPFRQVPTLKLTALKRRSA